MRGVAGQRTRAELDRRLHGGELPLAVGIGVAGRHAGRGLPDGEVQRGLPMAGGEVHVGAAVSQHPHAIGVVELRCKERRRGAVRIRVVDGGVARALE